MHNEQHLMKRKRLKSNGKIFNYCTLIM